MYNYFLSVCSVCIVETFFYKLFLLAFTKGPRKKKRNTMMYELNTSKHRDKQSCTDSTRFNSGPSAAIFFLLGYFLPLSFALSTVYASNVVNDRRADIFHSLGEINLKIAKTEKENVSRRSIINGILKGTH